MLSISTILYASAILALFPIAFGLYVVAREAYGRNAGKRTLKRLEAAQEFIETSPSHSTAEELAHELKRRLDRATLESVMVLMIHQIEAKKHPLIVDIFHRLGLSEHFAKLVREAPSWDQRAHAAEIVGLVSAASAVPYLVAALRDPHEDAASVKTAAANALSKLQDPAAVPLLARELHVIDDWSSPRVAEALVRFGATALPTLLELLADQEHPMAQIWAARILGRIGDNSAVSALIERLRDRQDLLRVAAAEALGTLGDRKALQPLIQTTLRDPAPQVRAHAAAALGAIGDASAMEVLVAALSDPDYGTRIRVLEALEALNVADTSALEKSLRDPNAEVRRRAALALDRVGYLERIVNQLASEDYATAENSYTTFLELGRAGLLDNIAAYIHDRRFAVRVYALKACGDLGATRVGSTFLLAVDDPEWPVRAQLARTLSLLKPPGSAALVVKLMTDPELLVREIATEGLKAFAPSELAPYYAEIFSAFAKGTVPIRQHVLEIVARFSKPETLALLVQATEDVSEQVRLCAVNALTAVSDPQVLDTLVARLMDTSVPIRMKAVEALGQLGTTESFDALLRVLPGADVELREAIAQSLARAGGEKLILRLSELTQSSEVDVRIGITWALGKTADTNGVPLLGRLLEDRDSRVRASAAGALGKIQSALSIQTLVRASEDQDPRTRAAVVNGLAKVAKGDGLAIEAIKRRLQEDPDRFVRNRAALAMAQVAQLHGAALLTQNEIATFIDEPVLTLALVLSGSEPGIARALELVTEPGKARAVFEILEKEAPSVRQAFLSALSLEDHAGSLENTLAHDTLIEQYRRVLRTNQSVQARQIAVKALSQLSSDYALQLLADALTSDPAEAVRLSAVEALALTPKREIAHSTLLQAISDPSTQVASVAIRMAGKSKDPLAAQTLFKRLTAGSGQTNTAVEAALAEIFRDNVLPFLDQMMGTEQPEILVAGIRVLQHMGTAEAFPLLQHMSQGRELSVRVAAIGAMGSFPFPEAAAELKAALQDPQEVVRMTALETLAGSERHSALEQIASARTDPSSTLRKRYAELLAKFQSSALPTVEIVLTDLSQDVRAAALATLLEIGTEDSVLMFGKTWQNSAVEAKSKLKVDKRAAALTIKLVDMLNLSRNAAVRQASIVAIAALWQPGYERHILSALTDPSPEVRIAAVRALAPFEDAEIRQRVSELMNDPDRDVREVAHRPYLRSVS